MKVTGIICEYNPLHLGHKKQFDWIRARHGKDSAIVCLMSGNFVQRGEPAIVDKMYRAEAALRCGADLVLELPVTVCLSSAEGFAAGGVKFLAPFCDDLCFGCETETPAQLMQIAKLLLSDAYRELLQKHLQTGVSFPAARQAALAQLGADDSIITQPNNILAVEYCKAILQENTKMQPMPILRKGGYHDTVLDPSEPSATALRSAMLGSTEYLPYIPQQAHTCFENAQLHERSAGERAMLAHLRRMTDADFEALPYGAEGLWRKLMHAARRESSVEGILQSVKSKRYTYSRISRMVMCAFLGITEEILNAPAPYARVLALNDTGRKILNTARQYGCFPNVGEPQLHPYQALENRCGDLYGLFAVDGAEPAGLEEKRRIIYIT